MTKKDNGLGMIKINTFWQAIKMSWLRRLSTSSSTWAKLHKLETKNCTFDPTSSNMEQLIRAKNMIKNSVWKDIYDALLTCRRNIVCKYPKEFLSVPINGEMLITKNFNPINQPWCSRLMIRDVLSHQGDWKNVEEYNDTQKPAFSNYLP